MARSTPPLLFFLAFLFLCCPLCSREEELDQDLASTIGTLFLVPACPAREEQHRLDLKWLQKERHISALLMKGGTPEEQLDLCHALEDSLFLVVDAEYGLGMRMQQVTSLPHARTLGETNDLDLVERVAEAIGQQCALLGVQMNLAPVADVNINPANPIIHARSFGDDPHLVAACALRMVHGMASQGILSCAKHFPGHGDVSIDSHRDLPILTASRERIKSVELVPFRELIQAGVPAVMSAHIAVPALDPTGTPATLSSAIMRELLQEEMGFEGCVITDALNMRALTMRYTHEEIAIAAIRAGCHLLLYGDHIAPNVDELLREVVPRAWKALYAESLIDPQFRTLVEEAAARVTALRAKSHLKQMVDEERCRELVERSFHQEKRLVFRKAMRLIEDRDGLLPLDLSRWRKIFFLHAERLDSLEKLLVEQLGVQILRDPPEQLREDECLIVPWNLTPTSGHAPLCPDAMLLSQLDQLELHGAHLLHLVFGSVYTLSHFVNAHALLHLHQDDEVAQVESFAQLCNRANAEKRSCDFIR